MFPFFHIMTIITAYEIIFKWFIYIQMAEYCSVFNRLIEKLAIF